MKGKTSIIDVPKKAEQSDLFGIEKFGNGLKSYISNCETPLTVALQGEWGSGKTSLMNSLNNDLCVKNEDFYPIWLNTWEYALLKDPHTTLLQVIKGLLEETITIFDKHNVSSSQELKNKASSFFKKALVTTAKIAANTVVGGSGEIVDHLVGGDNKEIRISDLRNQLEKSIEECLAEDNSKKGFIFFIDDLDRIDPPVAVQILELLKNIFTIKNCIFVLAIDYDVVVKGLESKFGKLTELNEREFRSFFDKIIQLPFSMPTSSYRVDSFIKDGLNQIGYLNETQVNNNELISDLSEITTLSVGTNPRTLKRLLNSISLISCINQGTSEQDEDYEILINYALVSIQIAYPSIYRLLVQKSNFELWDESLAKQLNLKELSESEKEILATSEEFDEEWEQILYRVCEKDIYLKKRALNISRLLNKLKDIIPESQSTEEVISSIISLSSVTNLEAFDKPLPAIDKSNFLKEFKKLITPLLSTKLNGKAELVEQQGKRIQSNLFIKFTKKDWGNWIRIAINPVSGGLELTITTDKWTAPITSDYQTDLKNKNIFEDLVTLKSDLDEFLNNNADYTLIHDFSSKARKYQKWHITEISLKTIVNNAEIIYKQDFQEKTAQFITEFYDYIVRLKEIKTKSDSN
jgi:hypothetical protein|tara:strand:+ start:1879 stop:3786 length:1908 start_codon:yes stop_codon:yes gene_type:complete